MKQAKLIISGMVASLVAASTIRAQPATSADWYPCGPHMMGWQRGWPAMMYGSLFLILALAAIAILAFFLIRSLSGSRGAAPPHERTALDILRERFARGEIDKDEFEERRRVLGE